MGNEIFDDIDKLFDSPQDPKKDDPKKVESKPPITQTKTKDSKGKDKESATKPPVTNPEEAEELVVESNMDFIQSSMNQVGKNQTKSTPPPQQEGIHDDLFFLEENQANSPLNPSPDDLFANELEIIDKKEKQPETIQPKTSTIEEFQITAMHEEVNPPISPEKPQKEMAAANDKVLDLDNDFIGIDQMKSTEKNAGKSDTISTEIQGNETVQPSEKIDENLEAQAHIRNKKELEDFTETHYKVVRSPEMGEVLVKEQGSPQLTDERKSPYKPEVAQTSPKPSSINFNAIIQYFSHLYHYQKQQFFVYVGGMVVVLGIILYFLVFSGKSSPDNVNSQKQGDNAQTNPVQTANADAEFRKYYQESLDLFNKAAYDRALLAAQKAQKINNSPQINELLANINAKIQENKAAEQKRKADELWIVKKDTGPKEPTEEEFFQQAKTQNTLVAYQEFVKKYPESIYKAEAEAKIIELKAKLEQDEISTITQAIQKRRKTRLRHLAAVLSKEEVEQQVVKGRNTANSFENLKLNGDLIIVDYSTGLLWHFWDTPMTMEKAKLWSIRKYANFYWRLPTVQEIGSARKLDIGYFGASNAEPIEVWTADKPATPAQAYWTIDLKSAKCAPAVSNETKYLCTVYSFD